MMKIIILSFIRSKNLLLWRTCLVVSIEYVHIIVQFIVIIPIYSMVLIYQVSINCKRFNFNHYI